MKPEEKAREKIDKLLEAAGWVIQDFENLNLGASLGVIIREFQMKTGPVDYLLFVNRKAVGVIEAKPEGTTLTGVDTQSDKYISGMPEEIPHIEPLPFAYETTGTETLFRDLRDPDYRSRNVFAFHKPETLLEWTNQEETLRCRLKKMPFIIEEGLRACQSDAIMNLEESFANSRPKSLVQMATGSGKTFAAVTSIYRLIKFAGAKRVLFLVDRSNLGRQTLKEFKQYVTPDDGRKFTELYNVQNLSSNTIDPVNKVCITTIQRLYSMLKGDPELEIETEEYSLFDASPDDNKRLEVQYNPDLPIETFDFIITDECHRSIYNLWRQVLEYFDAFLIGLTATPSKQTLGFFDQNLVTEYSHERAVADGVNVGYEVYEIMTKITEEGSKIEAGYYVDKRDRMTRKVRWEVMDEDIEYKPTQLDTSVVAPDQIRTIIQTFRDNLPEIFPGRTEVPKTLIFAKNDSHADDIVKILREEFGKGNEFCRKITYRTTGKTEDLISSFRNSYYPRIAVTVDMISTGTDIKPLECLLFMRDVRSNVYFEQMKGRGTRTIPSSDLQAVTPDAVYKTHFVIVDAVGVCEHDKTDSRPLERKRAIGFEKLINSVAVGVRDVDTITTLAGRLARLDRKLNKKDRSEIEEVVGEPFKEVINRLLDAVDPDKHAARAVEMFETEEPDREQIKQAREELANVACAPFDNPKVRQKIIEIKTKNDQIIDTLSPDILLRAGFSTSVATTKVESFKQFIEENKDEITALQIIYNKPYGQRHITYEQIKELADNIEKPPYYLTPEIVWKAYESLEKSRVRGNPHKLLTNIIQLIRFQMKEIEVLEPFDEVVNGSFENWLKEQENNGRNFNQEQMEWLTMIKDHIATSLSIEIDDFENVPFNNKGGAIKIYQLFGDDLENILEELNEVLAG
jgi:type I restriction enzyme R subunit